MSPRSNLNHDKVLAAAAVLVDEEGTASLTVARLAEQLKIRPPSLYNHMHSLEQLEQDLAVQGVQELAIRLRTAATGVAELDALRAMAHAYRSFAAQHPGLYLLSLKARNDREQYAAAALEVIAIIEDVLRGYHLRGEQMLHATRALRSAIHGFVSLEAAQGFGMPMDLNESFDRLIQMLHQGMKRGVS